MPAAAGHPFAGQRLDLQRDAGRGDRWTGLVSSARREVICYLVGPGSAGRLVESADWLAAAAARNVAVLVVHDRPALTGAEAAAARDLVAEECLLLETARPVPAAVLVVDGAVAVVAAQPPAPAGQVFRTEVMVELIRDWVLTADTAPPAVIPLDPRRLATLRQVARVLAGGVTDAVAARQLGLSLRTARRRIADLMQELDAQSRFQAGVAAARRGLV
jgi:DNA-binding NarL/FixJ family response regulator